MHDRLQLRKVSCRLNDLCMDGVLEFAWSCRYHPIWCHAAMLCTLQD